PRKALAFFDSSARSNLLSLRIFGGRFWSMPLFAYRSPARLRPALSGCQDLRRNPHPCLVRRPGRVIEDHKIIVTTLSGGLLAPALAALPYRAGFARRCRERLSLMFGHSPTSLS